MNLTKPEILFISLFMFIAMAFLLAIVWFIDTSSNCWDKYQTEDAAISHCEQPHG